MRGVPAEDPSCIHNIDELERRVEEIGFLPLFAGDVSGFSVEEHTVPEDWWTGGSGALLQRDGAGLPMENSLVAGQGLFPESGCRSLRITGGTAMTSMRAGTMNWRAGDRRRLWICSWERMQIRNFSLIR